MTASSRQGIFRENVWGGQTATAEGRETRGPLVGVAVYCVAVCGGPYGVCGGLLERSA